MMSITPQVTSSGGKAMEDCRDYLRTGRCKYGASCKYNHPPNVQNGGGVKPVDPSEPLFPSRPDEPICQYYLKHGTCKFGQACKFDHPPQNSMHVVAVGGQVQFMDMGHVNNEPQQPATPIVFSPVGADANGMVLQFLPQRVDEPDCIYFLKNGRCKYGATCRYHHPVPSHGTRRLVDKPRRQPDPYARSGQNVQYVAQMYPNFTPNRGLQSYDNSPASFVNINMDGSNGSSQSFHIVTGSDGVTSYCIPTGSAVPTEPGSSASSIASSYETSQEHLNDHWNRARRNGSGSSLNGAYSNEGKPQRVFLSQSISEGNIIPRQSRSTSYGSASEMNSSSLPRNIPSGAWNQRTQPIPYGTRQEVISSSPDPNNIQRRLIRRRDPRRGEGHDEGFTMMTSALLNMLDTPEEAAADNLSDDDYLYDGIMENEVTDHELFQRMSLQNQNDTGVTMSYDGGSSYVDRTSFEQVSMKASYLLSDKLSPSEETRTAETGQSWSPSWLGATEGPDDTGYAFSLLPPNNPPSQSGESDVGLYFP